MIKFNPFAQRSSGNVTPIPTVYSNYGMSISPEKAEEASYKLVATKYVNAANNANVNIGDTVNNVLSKIKENPALKSDYERYTKFLNTEVQKINKANQAVDQLKKIANDEYSKVLDEMNKTGNYDEKKLTSIESSLNRTIKH
jgi:prefoldin subunit 5